MDQIERIKKMIKEFDSNLSQQFGKYRVADEHIRGRTKVILTSSKGERFVMGFIINDAGLNLVAMPEEEDVIEEDYTLTHLERELLDKAGRRAVNSFQHKFTTKTGWELVDMVAIFQKGLGRIFLSWDCGEMSITEGELEDDELEDEE